MKFVLIQVFLQEKHTKIDQIIRKSVFCTILFNEKHSCIAYMHVSIGFLEGIENKKYIHIFDILSY